MPPKEPDDACDGCCWGCGRGAEAYRDRIDCFKSGLDCAPGVAAALDGRAGACASPKKSSPSNESAGFVCFGGAGSDFGGGLDATGAALFALGGDSALSSSPKRSCCGAL